MVNPHEIDDNESDFPSEDEEKEENNQSTEEKTLKLKTEFIWNTWTDAEKEACNLFVADYMKFLWQGRTERERVAFAIVEAEKKGYVPVEIGKNIQTLNPGDKIYYVNRNKNIALVKVGNEPITDKFNLLGGHLDTPRIDIKMHPLYEDDKTGVALFKTHYYGGIKKYQWLSIPLHLTGVIAKKDGTVINVDIGRNPEDPVFMIPDLLIHLAKELQGERKAFEVVKAEEMNALVGAIPDLDKKSKEKFKLTILKILHDKYDIDEADLQSAELSFVSGIEPRFVGFDKSLIGGAGQDDGVCCYTSIRAILDSEDIPTHTMMVGLFDKEEIGSNGNTGAQSWWLQHVINDLMVRTGVPETNTNLFMTLSHLIMLSADVSAPMDPSFPSVHDPKNTGALGKGPIIEKYTGTAGKISASDARAELLGFIRSIFENANVAYQFANLGAVDIGGGGTIAKFVAEHFNADVLDVGTPVLDMHSAFEITHIADVYDTYLAYSTFLKS